jgi:hypothetical protein
MKIRPVAAELLCAEGQIDMTLTVAFRNLAKAPHCSAPAYKEQNRGAYAYTHTCMPRVEFKPRIPMFERLKTVNVLDRAGAITGPQIYFHR